MKQRSCFLNPTVDFFMLGGLSILLLSVCFILIPESKDTNKLGWIMFYLSFFVNFPHFLISYQFLYIDNKKIIMKDWRAFTAAFIAPALLIAYSLYALSNSSKEQLSYLANAMFFLVGWHYIKQIYGCVIVSSALQKFYFNKKQKISLLVNAFGVWFISYFGSNQVVVEHDYYGIVYKTFAFPAIMIQMAHFISAASFLYLIWQLRETFIQEGKWPPLNSIVAFATLYIWHIPVLYHPSFFLMIPFFHSLQYLLIAFAYTKNRFSSSSKSDKPKKINLNRALLYISASFITGALFFYFIPSWLDKNIIYDAETFGPQLFLFSFTIFLNIHHYFIDFAIWRRDNKNIRKYLL